MEEEKPPVTITELLQLTDLGIPIQYVTWNRVSMTSDSHICVRYEEKTSQRKQDIQVAVLNLKNEGCPHKTWAFNADSAMLNPAEHKCNSNGHHGIECNGRTRLAIKNGKTFMVVQLEPKQDVVASCDAPEVIVYWNWLTPYLIGMVSETTVYHWHVSPGEEPERAFKRHQRLSFAEIISYKADPSLKWFALTGLIPQEDHICGVTQLYSVDNSLTQCISAHTVTFGEYKFEGNSQPSTILCVTSRDADSQGYGKIHVIELGPHIQGNLAPCSHYDHIKFFEDEEKYDFPIALQVSAKYGLVYIVTKYGYLYVCDLDTAACLCGTRISADIVFTTALNSVSQGIIGISRSGQVLSIEIQTDEIVQYVRDVAKKNSQADRLERVLPKLVHIT